MKQVLFIVLIITTLGSCTQAQNSEQKSLFERLGGSEGISAIVDGAVGEHMKNPTIQARFTPYLEQPERLAIIRQHTIDFFSAGSGGAVKYAGRDMPTTHGGMNISPAEYMAVVDDIMKVLAEREIDQASQNEVLVILWSLKGMIISQ